VRILRAIKFATRLDFQIEPKTSDAMKKHVGAIVRCAPARLQEELLRLLQSGKAQQSMALCKEYGVIEALMPELKATLSMELEAKPIRAAGSPTTVSVVDDVARDGDEDGAPAVDEPAAETHEGESGVGDEPTSDEAVAVEPLEEPLAAPRAAVAPAVPRMPAARWQRFDSVLAAVDQVIARGVEVDSAVLYAALLMPCYEALALSTSDAERWLDELGASWTERIRLTRRDRDVSRLLLQAQRALAHERYGQAARNIVTRPGFKDALLLLTISLQADGAGFDDVAKWKAIAHHYGVSYRQPKKGERDRRPRRARRQGRRPRRRRG
jgi:hypothetical protein